MRRNRPLSAQAISVLRALAADPTRAPLAAAMILDCLGRLVDKSMVQVEPAAERSRYRLLETIRQFGREQLIADGEEPAVRAAHLAYFLKLAVDHDPDRRCDVVEARPQLLDDEHDNLRAALGRALRTDPDAALLLAVSLWRFWLARGHFAEGSSWLGQALASASPGPGVERSRAYLALAVLEPARAVRPGSPSWAPPPWRTWNGSDRPPRPL